MAQAIEIPIFVDELGFQVQGPKLFLEELGYIRQGLRGPSYRNTYFRRGIRAPSYRNTYFRRRIGLPSPGPQAFSWNPKKRPRRPGLRQWTKK